MSESHSVDCDDCSTYKSDLFCCCLQVSLCYSCAKNHLGLNHYMLKNSNDIHSALILTKEDVEENEFTSYIDNIIKNIKKTSSNHCKEVDETNKKEQPLS